MEMVWEGDLDEDDFFVDDFYVFWDCYLLFDFQSLLVSCEVEFQLYIVLGVSVLEMIVIDEGCIWSNCKVYVQMRKEIKRLYKVVDQVMIVFDMIIMVMWKKLDDSLYMFLFNGIFLYEEKEWEMGKVEVFRYGFNMMLRLFLKDVLLLMFQFL